MSHTPPVNDEASPAASTGINRDDLAVVVSQEIGGIVARVTGEIDLATCEHLRAAIEPHLGPGQRVVLDLSGVHFMDSSCLGVFLEARTTLTADGGSLILRNPSDAARRLLSIAGMTELFDTEIGHHASSA